MGNLLSGLAGTMPLGFRPTGASMVEITGIGSRRIGLALGASFIVLAFVPKALAVILAIPGPVITVFVGVTMATIFLIGMKVVVQDGIDYRKGLIVGVSFWIGVGFQSEAIFPEHVSAFAGALLKNGMLTGGIVAIIMTMFVELTKPRRHRLEVAFDPSALHEIRKFIGVFASRRGWDAQMADRLDAVCEETLLTLQQQDEPDGDIAVLKIDTYLSGFHLDLRNAVGRRTSNRAPIRTSIWTKGNKCDLRPCHPYIWMRCPLPVKPLLP